MSHPSPDKTYKSIWCNYTQYVDRCRQNGSIPPGMKYLTLQNVENYYKKYVAVSTNCPKTVRKIRAALQYYVNRVEYLDDVQNRFTISSPIIDEALMLQQRKYNEAAVISTVDPHRKIPTNTLSHDDHILAMTKLLSNDNLPYWKSMSLSWTLGCACFFRPDTFLKLRLTNLYLDTRHVPPRGDKFTVSYLLFPSDLKGGQNNGTGIIRVAGSWRHRDYRRCAVGYLSMIFFVSFRNDTVLNFYAGANGNRPTWWDHRIVNDWKDSSTLGHTYRRFLDFCGIDHNKCSYIRTSGIDEAGFEGELFQDQIGTMSKHTTRNTKLDVFYMTELYPPVMRSSAGFKRGETYSVPRTEISIDWTEEDQLVQLVFPATNVWRSQIQSRFGDKSKAAANFVNELLPALAKVVIQDGIFWIRDFPNHYVSRFLLSHMPSNYERWAKEKRQWVDMVEVKRNVAAANNVNLVTQAVIHSLQDDFTVMKNQLTQNHIVTNKIVADLRDIILEKYQNFYSLSTPSSSTEKVINTVPAQKQVTCSLRNTALLPVVPKQLPNSIEHVLDQHLTYNLKNWNNRPMHGLETSARMALGRRKYLFDEIERRTSAMTIDGAEQEAKLRKAAKDMDVERKMQCMSVAQYLQKLKSLDAKCKKRKRSNNGDI